VGICFFELNTFVHLRVVSKRSRKSILRKGLSEASKSNSTQAIADVVGKKGFQQDSLCESPFALHCSRFMSWLKLKG
jgi:hypothetical protein